MPSQKAYLNQTDVKKILAAADAHAEKNNWGVSIAVVDDGGHLLGFTRRDACPTISDRKSTRLNSSHSQQSRMPSSA